MDLTSVMSTLMSADSVKNLSKKTGSSQKDVTSVLTAALPLLLQGADSQAKDETTAESFTKALIQHSEDDTSNLSNFLGNVDMADGAKIIGHLLGTSSESTTKKVSKSSGTDAESTAKILAAAAPLLMSLLGQETKKSKSSKNKTNELVGDLVTTVLDNVDVGSLLMGMLTDTEEDTATKKKTTTKKTTAKKTTTTKKSTTTKKKTAAKTTTKKKKAADSDDGVDLADAANLLIKLLK